jgi:hypothetical protein
VTVQLERATLTDGIPVMHAIYGHVVRAAYDPRQITEPAALAWLCLKVPTLVRDGFTVAHLLP